MTIRDILSNLPTNQPKYSDRKCGIYIILNLSNNKFYVGCSGSVYRRFSDHKSRLINGIHYNAHLQASWNKYGRNSFVFRLIEETSFEGLVEREQFYIDVLGSTNPSIGYNKMLVATNIRPESRKSISQRMNGNSYTKGKKLSDSHKQKLSEALKGRVVSEETKKKISSSRMGVKMPSGQYCSRSKLTLDQVEEIRRMSKTGISSIKLGKLFCIHSSTVRYILQGKTWKTI